jgi:ribosomal protein L32
MVVRMRATKGHRNNRRSHHEATSPTLSTEGESKVPHIRHRANPVTGKYRGRQVLDVDKKLVKRAKKEAVSKSSEGDLSSEALVKEERNTQAEKK